MHSMTSKRSAVGAVALALGALLLVIAASPAGAAFPGPNGKIAFQSNRTGTFDIFAANPDGSGLANLTATAGVDELDPAWSPDGRRVAYRRDNAIWVMNADGSAQTQLTPGSAAGESAKGPTWSPDGHQIAFSRSDTELGIWVINDTGGPEHQLTTQGDQSPAWSPNGQTIVVERHPGGFANRLVLVSADGSGEQPLDTGISSSNSNPAWSPDGTKIAFDSNGGEGLDVIDLLAGNVTAFGFGADPEWSPDGSAIVYAVAPDASLEIQWRPWPNDGSDGRSVTDDAAATDRSPTWQPAPSAPAPNTPAGSNVFVAPVDVTTGQTPVTIKFTNVAVAGDTSVVSSASGPPATGFEILGAYYEISTTATWDQSPPPAGGAEVCFKYGGSPAPSILHFVAGQQQPVLEPTTKDTGQEVCALVTSFSPFVLVRPASDTTPPTINCDAADGLWHGGNVSIQCTAVDTGSGLADPADASFVLNTSVPVGDETDNAATSSRQVCDVAGNCATAGPIAGNKVDQKGPTLTMPADLTVDATKPFAADVTLVSATATDGGFGVQSINCPVGTTTFPLGTTTVTCTAADGAGNSSSGNYHVTVRDIAGPTLSLPSNLIVNATSPAGAAVTYAASASDIGAPPATLSCSPASGATLAIGQTTVKCTATDAVGNASSGSFTVTVKGAKEQLADLIQKVVNASQLSPAAKTLLIGKLNQLLASFDPNNATQRQAVCLALQVFKAAVQLQAGKSISQAQAAEWIADANRIRAVLGC